MPYLPYLAPLQGLIAKCEKLRPAPVLTLLTDEPFHLAFQVDAVKAPNIVERRHRLSGLKDVAEFPLLVAQVQDTIHKYRS